MAVAHGWRLPFPDGRIPHDSLLFTLSANSTGAEDDTQVGGLIFFLTSMPLPMPFPGVKYSTRAFNGNGNSQLRELYANCP